MRALPASRATHHAPNKRKMEATATSALLTYGPLGIFAVLSFFVGRQQYRDNQTLQQRLLDLTKELANQAIEAARREEQRAAETTAAITRAANAVADVAITGKETKEAINRLTGAIESRKASNPVQRAVVP